MFQNYLSLLIFADYKNMFYCNNDIIQQTNAELDKLKVCFFVNWLSLNIR